MTGEQPIEAQVDQAWCVVGRDGWRDYLRVSMRGTIAMAYQMPSGVALPGPTPLAAVMMVSNLLGLGNYLFLGPGVAFDRDGEPLCAQCDGSGYDNDPALAGHEGACSECYGHGRPRDASMDDYDGYRWSR